MSISDTKISKFLSLVLRHKPDVAELTLDENGWVSIDKVIAGAKKKGKPFNRTQLERVVRESDKQRFAIDGEMIRANQGHSIQVNLELRPVVPPEVLFHGTVEKFMGKIKAEGLRKMNRHHVHLSPDINTANKVGGRRGEPIILEIDSAAMHRDGHLFMCSENGVWLTENVPHQYISILGREV